MQIRACPNCNSTNLKFYRCSGYDLRSVWVNNYFLECLDCGTSIKSRDFNNMIRIWNDYKK